MRIQHRSGKGLSLKRIIVELENNRKKSGFYLLQTKTRERSKIILNIDKVKQELNWEPKIDFKHGIRLNKLWIEEFLYSKIITHTLLVYKQSVGY